LRIFASAGCLLAAVLTLAFVAVALAQDEMPKDLPPPPAKKAIQPAQPGSPIPGNPAETDQQPSILPPGSMIDEPVAMLQALDKVTARVRRLPVKVGRTAKFGMLSVEVQACRKAPPEDPPESAAFLKITDSKGSQPQVVFSGWMFASSPALSAMDHPVYDIWVVDCAGDSAATTR